MNVADEHIHLRFNGAAVTQQEERCLNRRHRAAGCTECVASCPVDVIVLVDSAPTLDEETCVRCGLCLHSCPTGVFRQANAAEAQLFYAAAQQPEQPIAIVCAWHPTLTPTTAPAHTIVQHQRCLATLAVDQLLALS